MRIHLIMPMAGAGSRFTKNGFIVPKPIIEIQNKPFFYWSFKSIKKMVEIKDITFVVLKEHIENFEIDKIIYSYFPDAKIKVLEKVLNGPVLTCSKGVEDINDDLPIIFNDCDHAFAGSNISNLIENGKLSIDGGLFTFESNNPQFSYVRYDENGLFSGTIEKKVVSNHAICGIYLFKNVEIFKKTVNGYLDNCEYSEYYMSGLYNVMFNNGLIIKDTLLDNHVDFGTPEEYEKVRNSVFFGELDKC